MSNSLGIDLGTSSVKVAIYDSRLKFIDGTSVEYGIRYLEGGGAEQSPGEWWEAILSACGKLREQNPDEWKGIGSLAVTGQFSGTVPVDSAGNPLSDAIIWLDSRGEKETRKLISGFPGIEGYRMDKLYRWIHLTGGAPTRSGKDSISHILYLKANEPELFRNTHKFLEPKDFINYRLTGKFTSTYDSMVLHWITDNRNPSGIAYSDPLLKAVGIHRDRFPDLVGSWSAIGHPSPGTASELQLPGEAVVAGGSGDIQSAIVGSGCMGNFEPILYIGSSSWVSCHVPYKKTDLMHNIASLPSALPDKYFIAAEQENAGSALTYVRNLLYDGGASSYSELDALAETAPPGSEGLIFLPWLYGERAPVESKSLRSSFFNMSLSHGRQHFIRSVMEGVAYNTRWLLQAVEKFAGMKLPYLVMSGGGASSGFWAQLMADVLEREIRAMKEPLYVNTRGAAILSSMAAGNDAASLVSASGTETQVFRPDPSTASAHSNNYATFMRFYRDNRKSFSLLNA